jgi:hypothetical protein
MHAHNTAQMPLAYPARAAGRPRPHWIAIVACVAVTVAATAYLVRYVIDLVPAQKASETYGPSGQLERSSYANISGAHFTFTNLTRSTMQACTRGVLAAKDGTRTVRTVAVCTGDIKPRSTVTLDAPYARGRAEDACGGGSTLRGGRGLDWDDCTFDAEDVP